MRPLAFGTSGLRGLVTDITDLEAYVNTRGFLDYERENGDVASTATLAIAGDLRPSTHGTERSILGAVARAATDAGFEVVCCGRLPTPALMAYATSRGWPSAMVTGSHIPFDRNGIKFNRTRGEVLKEDEAPILHAVERARRSEYGRSPSESPFDDQGMFRSGVPPLPPIHDDARAHYRRRYLDFFPAQALAGLRIAVYEHSAVGAELLLELLSSLGAEVVGLGRSEEFIPIDTEALSAARLEELQGLADEGSGRLGTLDAVVSTDGDSDRPLVLAVAPDGRARFIPGDLLGVLVADYLDANAIAVPITANDAIERHFAARPVRIVRTRVGSPHVIAAAEGLDGSRTVGWEANGGFLTFTTIERAGRRLAALPTRDAMLPILCCLHAARERGLRVGELVDTLPHRFGTAGLLDGIPPEQGRLLESVLGPDLVARHFTPALGFGRLVRIDTLDGVRMEFDNADIVHIRQSGNAPQLRAHALADSEARAREIVAAALREPDGILRGLLASLV